MSGRLRLVWLSLGLVCDGPQSTALSPVNGVWRSEGWASVFEVKGAEMRSFEMTRSTCVPGFSATRHVEVGGGSTVSFRSRKGERFSINPGEDERHKRLQRPGGLTGITLTKISALPKVCTPPTANTPRGNFDVFAKTFAENYIAFGLRRMDWD